MEDVQFAYCLRKHDVHVKSYGFLFSEFVLNFHEAPEYLLNGTRLTEYSPHEGVLLYYNN